MTDTPAIETHGLTKRFGDVLAVAGLDLRIEREEIVGFLGPNGAGKSTTIGMLLGMLAPTEGSARVLGHDPHAGAVELGRKVGVLPERCALWPRLTAREHLAFAISMTAPGTSAMNLLDRVGLEAAADRRVDGFSTGMAQRVRLGLALVGEPELLILDESMAGLDPNGIARVRQILLDERERGATVFVSSHRLEDIRAICDRVFVLVDGRIRAVTPVDAFDGGSTRLVIEADGGGRRLVSRLRAFNAVDAVREDGDTLVVTVEPASETAIIQAELEGDPSVREITVEDGSLDRLFARLTGGDR